MTPKKGRNCTRDWRPAFLHHLCQWGNVSRAATKAKITRKTVYATRDKEPLFKAAWDDALEIACDGMEEEARRRAVEGSEKPIYYKAAGTRLARETP